MVVQAVRANRQTASSRRPIAATLDVLRTKRQAAMTLGPIEPGGKTCSTRSCAFLALEDTCDRPNRARFRCLSGPQSGLRLSGVLGAAVETDLSVIEPEVMVQVLVDSFAGGP